MLKSALFTFLTLITVSLWAQTPELKAWSYDSASMSQLKGLTKAKLLYDLGKFGEANAVFFSELEAGNIKGDDFLILANSLMAENKTALAKEFFMEFQSSTNNTYGVKADIINSLFKLDSSMLPMMRQISSSEKLYGISIYDGKLNTSKANNINTYILNCEAELTEERIAFARTSNHSKTSISYFNNGNAAVICMFDLKSKTSGLYVIKRGTDGWEDLKRIKFSDEDFDYCTPYFDERTSILYFSSNVEGGFGGYDLYMSYYVNGKFESPINLGSNINSGQHEINPVKIDDWLYFSSNGLPGKGGFDIFKYKVIDDFTYLLVNERKFNSHADEYDIARLSKDNYLINRHQAGSSYLVQYTAALPLTEYNGVVKSTDGKPIANAIVLIEDKGQGSYVKTRANGAFSVQVSRRDAALKVSVHAEGFESKIAEINSSGISEIQLNSLKSVQIVKVVNTTDSSTSEISYRAADEDSSVIEQNELPEELLQGVSLPKEGFFYVIVASARDYNAAYRSWSKWVETFDNLEILKFNDNLYRIGFNTGSTELGAISALQSTIKIKNDAWIIRPGTL